MRYELLVATAVIALGCSRRDAEVSERSEAPVVIQSVEFRSPDGCAKADAAYADPGADPSLPHQMDGFLGLFPSHINTAEIPIGKYILLLDGLEQPIQVVQRVLVTPTVRVVELRRGVDGVCRLVKSRAR